MTDNKIVDPHQPQDILTECHQISLWTIFRSYFIVGLTAFGMAILQKLKALVIDHAWLSEEAIN